MRFSRSAKATALLLLVSLQYTFAAVDVAICSSALCYPKVTGGKSQKAKLTCPQGFSMEKDASGKQMCMKRVPKVCAKQTQRVCTAQVGGACPTGSIAKKDCGSQFDISVNKTGRHLLDGGNALVKEINIVGHSMGMPQIILPKPAVSINVAKGPGVVTKESVVKFNGGSKGFPQIILPEPKVSITMPPMPKLGPEVKFEGNLGLGHGVPHIIPILPEPLVTVEVPKGGFGKPLAAPNVKTDLTAKHVTLDLSQLGPKHTVDVNLPAMPNLIHEATKMPNIEVNLPDNMPKVIDLSHLGPKKIYNITLPGVKVPKQGSITFRGTGEEATAKEPIFLDLTHLGHKHKTGINVKLPTVETNGAVLNVIVDDDKSIKDGAVITVPGHKEKHNTIINVPGGAKEFPTKESKLVIDVAANKDSPVHQALAALAAGKNTTIERVNIKMPDIDLTKHMHEGKDIVIEMQPMLKFDKDNALFSKTMPNKTVGIEKRINVEMKNITIPQMMKDTTVIVKPLDVGAVAKHLLPKKFVAAWDEQKGINGTGNSTIVTTTTTINMPEHTFPAIPVPKDKIDAAVSIPLKMGGHLLGGKNFTGPDGMINIAYKEEWVGGKPVLPNPAAKIIKKAEAIVDTLSAVHCATQCCTDETVEVCDDKAVDIQSVEPTMGCEEGWTMDAKSGMCSNGDAKVAACPNGMSRCSLDGKGVCVPAVEGKQGADLCGVFKAVCHKGTILAKSCTA